MLEGMWENKYADVLLTELWASLTILEINLDHSKEVTNMSKSSDPEVLCPTASQR